MCMCSRVLGRVRVSVLGRELRPFLLERSGELKISKVAAVNVLNQHIKAYDGRATK